MTRRDAGALGLALAGVVVAGWLGTRFNDRPHDRLAASAAGVMLVAAVASGFASESIARGGGQALVLANWVVVGVRGLVALVGALLAGRFGFEPQDRQALVLWMLAAYLTVLVFETVRAVRTADRQRLAKSKRAGGAND